MAYQVIPNTRGVKQWVGHGTDPNIEDVITLPSGDTMVNTKTSPWVKAMPWLVGAGIAGPHLASLLLPALSGGAAAAPAAASAAGSTAATTAVAPSAASGFWSPTTIGLLNAGIGAGTQLLGAGLQSKAANRAAQMQQQSNAETLAFLREQDAKDRAQYGEERTRLWGQQDVDRARAEENRQLLMQREREREARLAPFRRDSGAYRRLADLVVG